MKKRSIALFAVLGVAGLVLLLGLILFYFSAMLAAFATKVPAASRPNVTPATLGLPFEERTVTSSDGLRLKAWWIPAASGARKEEPVIIIHGLGAGKEFMLSYIALAHADGHPALAIDLRGHGESAPSPTTLGDREPLDVEAWAAQLHEAGFDHPILWGTSLGAVTALRAGAVLPVGGVIADAPFDTLRHTLAVHARLYFNLPEYPLLPLAAWQIERMLHFPVDEVNSYQAVAHLHAPLLLLAAEKDQRMSVASIEAIYAAAHEPKELYIIPGEDHETRHFAPAFQQEVTEFLARCGAFNSRSAP